jgi:DNA adenine methylase
MKETKPFVKWAGGKSQILSEIRMKYPHGLGKSVNKYAEPFVGGGAVLFDVLSRYNLDEVYISDINRELIHTYTTIRDDVEPLIGMLRSIENEYNSADETSRKAMYYSRRKRFNELKAKKSESVEIAALFIFLNKTCFNGLYRVNRNGQFNVPQGGYKKPKICDESVFRTASERLRNVIIACADYKCSCDFIDSKTFVYFDPPYRPLTESASFTAYSQYGFDDSAQTELARFIDSVNERGAWVVASNSDPKNTNESDDFFDRLYAKYKILRIEANRAINSAGNGRGRIKELLIANGR